MAGICVSMHGRGRVFDNIFIERLWRTVKHEDIYIKEYTLVPALVTGLEDYSICTTANDRNKALAAGCLLMFILLFASLVDV
jgi:putative transposase